LSTGFINIVKEISNIEENVEVNLSESCWYNVLERTIWMETLNNETIININSKIFITILVWMGVVELFEFRRK
jgi:hypothetical protein